MPITWTSLWRQYRNDTEFRGCSHSFALSFGIALISWHFGLVVALVALLTSIPFAFFSGRYFGQKPICAVQATLLGLVNGSSVALFSQWYGTPLALICSYFFIFSLFHFSEFFFTAISNRRSLQSDSFLLNHSKAYWVAAVASWMEFFLEAYFTSFLKVYWISLLGFLMCLCGETLRKLAMIHAGSGFTHRLALSKRPDHRLVTTGIYAYLRHPGYTGLFPFFYLFVSE
ncbi:isoprenylcysteine carboxyl methyltransferase family protein, partial [Necator americanus]